MKAWLAGMAVVQAKTLHIATGSLQYRKGAWARTTTTRRWAGIAASSTRCGWRSPPTVRKSSRLTTCIDVGIETCALEAAAFSMNTSTISLTRKDHHA